MTKHFSLVYLILLLRYLFIAGGFFFIFYIIKPKKYLGHKLQTVLPRGKDYYREVGYSLLSFIFFAAFVVIFLLTPVRHYTLLYRNIGDYGWPYFVVSIILAVVIHDAYFYWTHRLMHHPKIFKSFHLVHHKSTNPSPWAAFAFHPLEALVEAGILPVLVFIIPMHDYAISIFFVFSTFINVYGHLGYEIYPAWLVKSKIGKWLNTSVSHNMHHKYFTGNYGFYTRVWDVLMDTVNPDYSTAMDEVVQAKKIGQSA
jgi:sterol desaturase/sphingolipid hydroxylase (fatty acid hydroxylase superfamily)